MRRKILNVLMPLGMSAFLVPTAMAMGSRPPPNDREAEKANARLQPAARNEVPPSAATKAPAGNRSGEHVYKTFCDACHGKGTAGAPKPGDKEAWAPRLDLGVGGLVYSVITGKNAMPPRGGTTDVTDEEIRRAVIFLANKSGANFK